MHLLRFRSLEPLTHAVMALANAFACGATCCASTALDLSRTTVVVRPGNLPAAEQTAARVLVEEVRKRTGLDWPISTEWPVRGSVIAISSGHDPGWHRTMPRRQGAD